MPSTGANRERTKAYDHFVHYAESALNDRRVRAKLGDVTTRLLDRLRSAYLPNVDENGIISMPKGRMDTDSLAILPVLRSTGSHYLSPDWFMPSTVSLSDALPMLREWMPDKNEDEATEFILSESLGAFACADYFSTDLLPYFRDGNDFGPIAAFYQEDVLSVWEFPEEQTIPELLTQPIILLGPTEIHNGSAYGNASVLIHELSHSIQSTFLGKRASGISCELFAYRSCAAVLQTFADEIDPEILKDHEFSIEVETMRTRVNPADDPFAEHIELTELFSSRIPDESADDPVAKIVG